MVDKPLYQHPFFQRIAGETWRPGGRDLTRHGLDLCSFLSGESVLDIGCGCGASLELMCSMGLRVTGLDKEYRLKKFFPFVMADASMPPFAPASFDGLLCECVLSLLPDPEHALYRYAVLLRSGGKLLLTDLYNKGQALAHPPDDTLVSLPNDSCFSGAHPKTSIDTWLQKAGLQLICFEDHSSALRELAARLLWYGGDETGFMSTGIRSSCRGHVCSVRGIAYGLWIAFRP